MSKYPSFALVCFHAVIAVAALAPAVYGVQDADQEEKLALEVALDLRDGTHLVGKLPGDTAIQLLTDFGNVKIPLALVAAIEFGENQKTIRVLFHNRDILSGVCEIESFKLRTCFGEASVPRTVTARLESRGGETALTADFKVTARKYSEKDDLGEAVTSEFGPDYRLADWEDIRRYADVIEEWAKGVGLPNSEDDSYLISRGGSRFWQGRRHYFVSRFDHNKPGYYLAHDNIKDDYLCLGSWYDLTMRVLAIKKSAGGTPKG